MTKLYSYVLREDTGFAPNPYHGFCTLACCKGPIRMRAEVGDWIIGTGSDARGKWRGNYISYAMLVTDVLTFDEYWRDERFLPKRPNLDGNLTESCGDNIYQFDYATGCWCQEFPAYHCKTSEMEEDTSVERVLISDDFVYWGGSGPLLPEFRGCNLVKIGPYYKVKFPEWVVEEFIAWIGGLKCEGQKGVCGKPLDLKLSEKSRREAQRRRVDLQPTNTRNSGRVFRFSSGRLQSNAFAHPSPISG